LSARNENAITAINNTMHGLGESTRQKVNWELLQSELLAKNVIARLQVDSAVTNAASTIAQSTSMLLGWKKTVEELELSRLENAQKYESTRRALRRAEDEYFDLRKKEIGLSLGLARAVDERRLQYSMLF
jgi:hypothetical protein